MSPARSKLIDNLILFFFFSIVVGFYFFHWRCQFFYGDDLTAYIRHELLNGSLWQQLNMSVIEEKFRPVQSVLVHILIVLFKTNQLPYFIFNVAIQGLNALVLFRIILLLTESKLLSILMSLVFAICKLVYFNVSQLIYGAAQEGLSNGFFLLSLLFLLKAYSTSGKATRALPYHYLLWSILCINLSIYAHERYLPMLAFIAAVLLLPGWIQDLSLRQRLAAISLTIGSVILNITFKSLIFHLSFFKGTAGHDMDFDLERAKMFYGDALKSLVEINMGHPVIVGLPYSGLHDTYFILIKVLQILLCIIGLVSLSQLTFDAIRKDRALSRKLATAFLLAALCLLLIVPISLTIRLEHRWQQGPFCVFLILVALLIKCASRQNLPLLSVLSVLVPGLFLWIDIHYFTSGIDKMYLRNSDRFVRQLFQAYRCGKIRPQTRSLLLYEEVPNKGHQDWINWVAGSGYVFKMFGGDPKHFEFIDSTCPHQISTVSDTTQIIYMYEDRTDTLHDPAVPPFSI